MNYLECNNAKEGETSIIDMLATEYQHTATKLAQQIDDHKQSGNDPATSPGGVDVVPLLVPLEPHANAILQKSGYETETGNVWKDVFAMSQYLQQ